MTKIRLVEKAVIFRDKGYRTQRIQRFSLKLLSLARILMKFSGMGEKTLLHQSNQSLEDGLGEEIQETTSAFFSFQRHIQGKDHQHICLILYDKSDYYSTEPWKRILLFASSMPRGPKVQDTFQKMLVTWPLTEEILLLLLLEVKFTSMLTWNDFSGSTKSFRNTINLNQYDVPMKLWPKLPVVWVPK